MTTFTEAARVLRQASKDLKASTRRSVAEATALLTAAVAAGQVRAGAGSGRLRGVGKSGATIGVRGTVRGSTGLVRATGPAWLLDHPTKPHTITARTGRVLALPDGGRPTSVQHPGTRGKPYFEEAVAEVTPKIADIFDRNAAAALGKAVG